MRHYTAVEVDLGEAGAGWHYATVGRRGGGPIGPCSTHPPHPTEADARRCYRAYERAQIELDPHASSWSDCFRVTDGKRCRKAANNVARSGAYNMAILCDDHFTPEDAVVALHLDGDEATDSWRS